MILRFFALTHNTLILQWNTHVKDIGQTLPNQSMYCILASYIFVSCILYLVLAMKCPCKGHGTNSSPHVRYMGISYSRKRAHGTLKATQSIRHWPFEFSRPFQARWLVRTVGGPGSLMTSSTWTPIMPCESRGFSSLSRRFFVNIYRLTTWNGQMDTLT